MRLLLVLLLGQSFWNILGDDQQNKVHNEAIVNTDNYKYSYGQDNLMRSMQQGVLRNSSNWFVEGEYEYKSPEGALITVRYIADMKGFRTTNLSQSMGGECCSDTRIIPLTNDHQSTVKAIKSPTTTSVKSQNIEISKHLLPPMPILHSPTPLLDITHQNNHLDAFHKFKDIEQKPETKHQVIDMNQLKRAEILKTKQSEIPRSTHMQLVPEKSDVRIFNIKKDNNDPIDIGLYIASPVNKPWSSSTDPHGPVAKLIDRHKMFLERILNTNLS